ncbi:MAG: hypothetical protein AAGG48_10625 [Planctomycetota bacterium]
MRYTPAIQIFCLTLLPLGGCGSSGWRFWSGNKHSCETCTACENQLLPTDTVTLGQPPMMGQPAMMGEPMIEYLEPSQMPDNFRAVEPRMDTVPSEPESVPAPAPDPAT